MSEGHGLPRERLEFAVQLPRLDPDGTGDIIKVWANLPAIAVFFFTLVFHSRGQDDESTPLTNNTIKR